MRNDKVAERVRDYVSARPMIKEALRRKIVNYSSLAREIGRFYRVSKPAATAAALRRYARVLKAASSHDRVLDSLFVGVNPVVRTGMCIGIVRPNYSFEALNKVWHEVRKSGQRLQIIEAERVLTIIFSNAFVGLVRRTFGRTLQEIVEDVALVGLMLPERSMKTPGVSARLSHTFAGAGVNLLEELTCSGEYLFAIDERDLERTLKVLKLPSRE